MFHDYLRDTAALIHSQISIPIRKWRIKGIVFLTILVSAGCNNSFFEQGTRIIVVDDKNPPTFRLTGSGFAVRVFLRAILGNSCKRN